VSTFWRNNALSTVLMLLFAAFWAVQAMTGWAVHNSELRELHQHTLTLWAYLGSPHFWSTTAENWESEFLQMGSYVVLTVYLKQRGSAESNPYPEEETEEETEEDRDRQRQDARAQGFIRRNSLSVALFGLFGAALLLHLRSSFLDYNLEQLAHGQDAVSVGQFLMNPEFWFESFQNWQSEFLAVATIVVFTFFLRQVGSSQSKGADEPNGATGG
jgi:hypothetical protein